MSIKAQWEKLGGGMARVRKYDSRKQGLKYTLKCLNLPNAGANLYEVGKFSHSADEVMLSKSIWNLYTANGVPDTGSIEMFTPDGAASVYASDLDSPFALAIQPGLLIFTPKLAINTDSTNAVVSWPAALGKFTLETTATLSAPNWNPVLNAPSNNNGSFAYTNFFTGPSQFFRLKKNSLRPTARGEHCG